MAIAVTPTREIICPGCGRTRLISTRNARRAPKTCNLCRHPGKHKAPEDKDRRFWLQRFTDEEILEMVFGIFEEEGDLQSVRIWRSELACHSVDEILINRVLDAIEQKETNEPLPANGQAQLRVRVGSKAGA